MTTETPVGNHFWVLILAKTAVWLCRESAEEIASKLILKHE